MTLLQRWRYVRAEPRRWVAAIAAIVVLFQLGLRGWAGYRGYFYLDDFAFTGRSAQYGLSPGKFLFRSYNNHLMPGAFAEVWTLTKLWPLDFGPVVTLALIQQVVLGILFYKLLRTLFGPRAGILVPFAAFTLSPITLPAFLWWAASLNQLPQQIATIAVLLCHVQYLRNGRVRRGALGVVALAGGLLFSEKTLLALPLVVAFTVAFAAGGPPWARVRTVWREHRAVWLAYLLLTVPYVLYYVLAVPSPRRNAAKGGDLVSLAATAVRDALLPGALGGPWTWHPIGFAGALAGPGSIATFTSAVIVVAGIVITVAWNRASAGAWLIGAGFVTVDVLLLGLTRSSVIGPIIGSEYRYFTDCAMVLALAMALSIMPIAGSFARGSVQRIQRRDWADAARASVRAGELRTAVWRPSRLSTALLVVLAVVVSSSVSTIRYDRFWHPNPARPYVTTLHDELRLSADHVVLYDQAVPPPVIWGLLYPYDYLSRLTATWPHPPRFLTSGHPAPALAVVDDTGHLRAPAMQGVTNAPGPLKACGYLIRTNHVSIRLAAPSINSQAVLRMGYIANADGTVHITTGSVTQSVPVIKGLNSAYLTVPGALTQVRISAEESGLSVCTDDVVVGLPSAIPGTNVR